MTRSTDSDPSRTPGADTLHYEPASSRNLEQIGDTRLHEVIDDLQDGYYQVDLRGNFVAFNQALCRIHGYSAEAMMGMNNRQYTRPEVAEEIFRIFNGVYRTGEPVQVFNYEIIRADGSPRIVDTSVHLVRDRDGQPVGFRGIIRDITEQQRNQAYEQARTRALERIARNAPLDESLGEVLDAVRIQMPEAAGAVMRARQGRLECVATVAVARRELAFMDDQPIAPDAGFAGRAAAAGEIVTVTALSTDPCVRSRRKAARQAGLQAAWAQPILCADGETLGVLVLFPSEAREPSEREREWLQSATATAELALTHDRMTSELAYLSQHDTLTGLLNRRAFMTEAERLIALAHRHGWSPGLLFIDLDRFKTVNDSWGHVTGDYLLQAAAERLRQTLRTSDCLARLGGDEFALLAPELTVASAQRLAQRVRQTLSEPFELDSGPPISVNASVGIAFASESEETVDALVGRADEAMYQAKQRDEGWAFYEPEQHRAAQHAVRLEQDLRRALSTDELILHYQAIRDLRRSRWVGSEALVRWQHPELGELSPAEFVPLAESRGLIRQLDRYVLERAVRESVGRRGWVSVNVSPHSLGDPDWVGFVRETLRWHDVAPRRLVLEVTERVMLDPPRVRGVMAELAQLGVRLALDDFGTGYSSLAYLTELPMDFLKVDKSLVRDVAGQPRNAVVVQTILVLARHLGMVVIAEGVENEVERSWLTDNACRYAQGFGLAMPAPPGPAAAERRKRA